MGRPRPALGQPDIEVVELAVLGENRAEVGIQIGTDSHVFDADELDQSDDLVDVVVAASTVVSNEAWARSTTMPRTFIVATNSRPTSLNPWWSGVSVCIDAGQEAAARVCVYVDAG